ncbi:MAG: DUF4232 domain-containing protein [Acidimicrobiales bacterium]
MTRARPRAPRSARASVALATGLALTSVGAAQGPNAASAASAACRIDQLSLSATGNSGLGHGGDTVVLASRGRGTCFLHGYPRVVGVTSNGEAVAAIDTRQGYLGGVGTPSTRLPTVVLRYGAVASFTVENLDFRANGSSNCPLLRALRLSLPGSSVTRSLSVRLLDCATLYVHPIVPGGSGVLR